MCGLCGALIGPGADQAVLRRVAELHRDNLLANEVRGDQATGIAVLRADSTFEVDKAPLPAHRYVESGCFQRILSCLDPSVTILLGHTRDPTKGPPGLPSNNHPIVRGDTVGIHNGEISNDDEIFMRLIDMEHSGRIGSVDSEAIFALIDRLPRGGDLSDYARRLHTLSTLLAGSYTILYFHPDEPYTLYLLKYKNPISAYYDPGLNCLFFSSRYLFLRKAFGRAAGGEGLMSRSGYVFDARTLATGGGEPRLAFPLADQLPRALERGMRIATQPLPKRGAP